VSGRLDIAKAALIILSPMQGEQPTLDDLTARLAHLKGSQDDWREAVAFLAAQVHAERRIGDAAMARDAQFTLNRIRALVGRFDEQHP